MTPKLTMTTTAFIRVLSAVGALSVPMAMPSMGASTDLPAVDSGMPSSIEGGLAQTLTRIDVQRGTDDIRVVISGDGKLAHEVTRLDERRLMIDIPGVASVIRKPVIPVDHKILKQVRLGYHADKVRVVLDLAGKADYSIEPQGANLIVTLREGAGTDMGSSTDLYRGETGETLESENPVVPQIQADATSRVAQRTMARVRRASTKFHVQTVQMTSEVDGGEKSTPKEDLVVGETRYIGRRISLDFQQADISNVLRLIAEVSGFNMVVGEGVKSKVTMKLVSVPWDQLVGGGGSDWLNGSTGNDQISGGAGHDTLSGDYGNDTLDGGAGNDWLDGSYSNNVYLFGRGDGQDIISGGTYETGAGKLNIIRFKAGVTPADLLVRRVFDTQRNENTALQLQIAGTEDRITANWFFYNEDPTSPYNPVQQVEFADGTVWNLAAIRAALGAGTAANESYSTGNGNDVLVGGGGSDRLNGSTGNDQISGGAGHDTLSGEYGNDTLDGGRATTGWTAATPNLRPPASTWQETQARLLPA